MKKLLALTLLVGVLSTSAQAKECSMLSITKLPADHYLTKAGLEYIQIARKPDVGIREGDVIFKFPYGKVVMKPYYPPIKWGQIPPLNSITLLQESLKARKECFGARTWDREPGVHGDWVMGAVKPMRERK